jgi:hypothetical protein
MRIQEAQLAILKSSDIAGWQVLILKHLLMKIIIIAMHSRFRIVALNTRETDRRGHNRHGNGWET